MSRRRWTAVDYSGCTLSSNNDLVFVIISLWATVTSTSDGNDVTLDLPALEGEVQQMMSSLCMLPCNSIVHFTILLQLY